VVDITSRPDRPHENGFENLNWPEWHAKTGLPKQAFEEWLTKDALTRRDIVGIFSNPDELQKINEAL